MKKYSEYLNEQYTPLTRDEVMKLQKTTDNYLGQIDPNSEDLDELRQMTVNLNVTLSEVAFLRKQMAVAYEYIGRRAPNPAPAKYRDVMHHATRIRKEELEAGL